MASGFPLRDSVWALLLSLSLNARQKEANESLECPNYWILNSTTKEIDDDALNEDWINYRMVRPHRSALTLLSVLLLVAIGVGRRIQVQKDHIGHWCLPQIHRELVSGVLRRSS
jgi:hypothetical protein